MNYTYVITARLTDETEIPVHRISSRRTGITDLLFSLEQVKRTLSNETCCSTMFGIPIDKIQEFAFDVYNDCETWTAPDKTINDAGIQWQIRQELIDLLLNTLDDTLVRIWNSQYPYMDGDHKYKIYSIQKDFNTVFADKTPLEIAYLVTDSFLDEDDNYFIYKDNELSTGIGLSTLVNYPQLTRAILTQQCPTDHATIDAYVRAVSEYLPNPEQPGKPPMEMKPVYEDQRIRQGE